MENFKKKLLKLGRGSLLAPVLLIAVAVIAAVVGIASSGTDFAPFDPFSGGYAEAEVTYLMGPFAAQTQDGKTSDEYYLAEDSDGYWVVVDTGSRTSLPVYGEDVTTDEELAGLPVKTLQGRSTTISDDLAYYLVDFFYGTDLGVTTENYADYFGDHYLDTTDTGSGDSFIFYLLAGIFGFLGLALLISVSARGGKIKKQLGQMEQSGELQRLAEDFSSERAVYSKKLRLAVSPHYLLDMTAPQGGLQSISLDGVTNVFKCNMINGEPTATSYIALETQDGERRCVAPCNGKAKEFDAVLAGLKKNLAQGGALQ